ncbi:MAG: sulfotransferase [Thermoleophilia bacterium]|nr:sulfotransferase [Thermoleophilia bacterium]
MSPPLLVLGVRRSGTTLLRVMLDRNSQLAVPDESYFVPQLAHRHRGRPDPDAFVDDLRRLPTLREWGVSPDEVRARLRPGMTTGEAIGAIYEAYAAGRGKPRWGDKTPMYMDYLPLLERLFPRARFVHLIRDGRDAALSFLAMPAGVVTRTWMHPRSPAAVAAQWRAQVRSARGLGARVGSTRYHELRYEELVADAEEALRRICAFAALPFEPAMLAYAGEAEAARKPHQRSLERPPTPGLRDWRADMSTEDRAAFEGVAGDLLAELGYETSRGPDARGRLHRARYAGLTTAWKAAAYAVQRSPLWRRRHPPLA